MQLKKLALAAALIAAPFTAAHADGKFDGAYVGGDLGLVNAMRAHFHDYDDFMDNENMSGSSKWAPSVNFVGGYTMESDGLVCGLELGYGLSAVSTEASPDYNNATDVLSADLKDSLSLLARVGVSSGSNLVYVGLGVTQATASAKADDGTSGGSLTSDVDLMGQVVALGVEHATSGNLSVRAQLTMTSFDASPRFEDESGNVYQFDSSLTSGSVGVNYRF